MFFNEDINEQIIRYLDIKSLYKCNFVNKDINKLLYNYIASLYFYLDDVSEFSFINPLYKDGFY